MVIKVDDDFVNDIFDNGLSRDELHCFSRLFEAMFEKKMFVRADDKKFYKWFLDNHPSYFSENVRGILTKMYNDFTIIMSEAIKIDFLYSITRDKKVFCNETSRVDKCSIPLLEIPNELSPSIYAENDDDAQFYYGVFSKLKRGCPTYIQCRSFGGGSGKSTIRGLIKDKIVFFAIIDSDKSYPTDAMGGTAKGIRKLFKRNRLYWSQLTLTVREKENLLPIQSILLQESETTEMLRFLKYNTISDVKDYFDIKSGIDSEKFYEKKQNSNWWSINHYAIDYLETEEGVVFPDQNKKSINGVGDAYISSLQNSNKIIYSSIITSCTKNQKEDWDRIMSAIVKYGYCYNHNTN